MNPRSERAWAQFQANIAALGGIVLEPAWLGSKTSHRVRCAAGHECTPRPDGVQHGDGICRICAGHDPATAWVQFQANVTALGGVVLEPAWLGCETPHRVRCPSGHGCTPRPSNLQRGEGICRICAGFDPATAWMQFQANIAALGGVVLEPAWLGSKTPHRVRCAAGHKCTPRPDGVQQGGGICMPCRHQYDTLYLVVFRERWAKIGVAMGGRRICQHLSRGYAHLADWPGLPEGQPMRVERSVLRALRGRGIEHAPYTSGVPLDGITETFAIKHLPAVLRLIECKYGLVLDRRVSS